MAYKSRKANKRHIKRLNDNPTGWRKRNKIRRMEKKHRNDAGGLSMLDIEMRMRQEGLI